MSVFAYHCTKCEAVCSSRVGQTKDVDGRIIRGLGTWRCRNGCKNKNGKTSVRRVRKGVSS